jgi:hypothetical protein
MSKSTDVFYTLADGTRGSYRAATADLVDAVWQTREQLIADAIDDGVISAEKARNAFMFADIATITKAEVVA